MIPTSHCAVADVVVARLRLHTMTIVLDYNGGDHNAGSSYAHVYTSNGQQPGADAIDEHIGNLSEPCTHALIRRAVIALPAMARATRSTLWSCLGLYLPESMWEAYCRVRRY